MERLARLGGGEEHGQRRAVIGGGQSAGVAVGQHALPVAEQFGPVAADRPAHLPIFLVDGLGLGQQRGGDFGGRSGRAAARPHRFIRSKAQNRLTAVGRLVAR